MDGKQNLRILWNVVGLPLRDEKHDPKAHEDECRDVRKEEMQKYKLGRGNTIGMGPSVGSGHPASRKLNWYLETQGPRNSKRNI